MRFGLPLVLLLIVLFSNAFVSARHRRHKKSAATQRPYSCGKRVFLFAQSQAFSYPNTKCALSIVQVPYGDTVKSVINIENLDGSFYGCFFFFMTTQNLLHAFVSASKPSLQLKDSPDANALATLAAAAYRQPPVIPDLVALVDPATAETTKADLDNLAKFFPIEQRLRGGDPDLEGHPLPAAIPAATWKLAIDQICALTTLEGIQWNGKDGNPATGEELAQMDRSFFAKSDDEIRAQFGGLMRELDDFAAASSGAIDWFRGFNANSRGNLAQVWHADTEQNEKSFRQVRDLFHELEMVTVKSR